MNSPGFNWDTQHPLASLTELLAYVQTDNAWDPGELWNRWVTAPGYLVSAFREALRAATPDGPLQLLAEAESLLDLPAASMPQNDAARARRDAEVHVRWTQTHLAMTRVLVAAAHPAQQSWSAIVEDLGQALAALEANGLVAAAPPDPARRLEVPDTPLHASPLETVASWLKTLADASGHPEAWSVPTHTLLALAAELWGGALLWRGRQASFPVLLANSDPAAQRLVLRVEVAPGDGVLYPAFWKGHPLAVDDTFRSALEAAWAGRPPEFSQWDARWWVDEPVTARPPGAWRVCDVRDGSVGLAAAVALRAALEGWYPPRTALFTGQVDRKGQVTPVAGVTLKSLSALAHPQARFFVPAAGLDFTPVTGVQPVPVSTVGEAVLACHSDGEAQAGAELRANLKHRVARPELQESPETLLGWTAWHLGSPVEPVDVRTQGGYVLLLGEPGRGKSTVVAQLAQRHPDAPVHFCKGARRPGWKRSSH